MPAQLDQKYWKDRADEMRGLADTATDQTAKVLMLQVARDFERLAEHAWREAAKPTP
jgi:hypothetical protein